MSEALALTYNTTELGEIFVKSGLFADVGSKEKAIVKILAGKEIGISPIEAMTGIHIIKGKVALGSNLMAAGVKKSGKYDYKVTKHTDKECSIDFYEGKDKIGTSSFTIEDAKKAGVWNSSGTWSKYPKNMLFARAMSNGVKWYCPDVFGHAPVYVPEELGAVVNEEGEPINITPAEPQKPTNTQPSPSSSKSLPPKEKSQESGGKQANDRCSICNDPLVPVREGHKMAGKPRCVNENCQNGFPDCPLCDSGVLKDFYCITGKGLCCDTCHAVAVKPEGYASFDADNEVCQKCPASNRCDGDDPGVTIYQYDGADLIDTAIANDEEYPYFVQLEKLETLIEMESDEGKMLKRIKAEVGYRKTGKKGERDEKAGEVLKRFDEAM